MEDMKNEVPSFEDDINAMQAGYVIPSDVTECQDEVRTILFDSLPLIGTSPDEENVEITPPVLPATDEIPVPDTLKSTTDLGENSGISSATQDMNIAVSTTETMEGPQVLREDVQQTTDTQQTNADSENPLKGDFFAFLDELPTSKKLIKKRGRGRPRKYPISHQKQTAGGCLSRNTKCQANHKKSVKNKKSCRTGRRSKQKKMIRENPPPLLPLEPSMDVDTTYDFIEPDSPKSGEHTGPSFSEKKVNRSYSQWKFRATKSLLSRSPLRLYFENSSSPVKLLNPIDTSSPLKPYSDPTNASSLKQNTDTVHTSLSSKLNSNDVSTSHSKPNSKPTKANDSPTQSANNSITEQALSSRDLNVKSNDLLGTDENSVPLTPRSRLSLNKSRRSTPRKSPFKQLFPQDHSVTNGLPAISKCDVAVMDKTKELELSPQSVPQEYGKKCDVYDEVSRNIKQELCEDGTKVKHGLCKGKSPLDVLVQENKNPVRSSPRQQVRRQGMYHELSFDSSDNEHTNNKPRIQSNSKVMKRRNIQSRWSSGTNSKDTSPAQTVTDEKNERSSGRPAKKRKKNISVSCSDSGMSSGGEKNCRNSTETSSCRTGTPEASNTRENDPNRSHSHERLTKETSTVKKSSHDGKEQTKMKISLTSFDHPQPVTCSPGVISEAVRPSTEPSQPLTRPITSLTLPSPSHFNRLSAAASSQPPPQQPPNAGGRSEEGYCDCKDEIITFYKEEISHMRKLQRESDIVTGYLIRLLAEAGIRVPLDIKNHINVMLNGPPPAPPSTKQPTQPYV